MNIPAEIYEDDWTVSSKSDDQIFPNKNKLKDTAQCTIGNQGTLDRNRINMDSDIHPVWAININGELRSLSKPLALRVSNVESRYYAENDILDICGYGDSPQDAVSDAVGDITYLYSHYAALSDNDVIGHGEYLKAKFNELLKRNTWIEVQ